MPRHLKRKFFISGWHAFFDQKILILNLIPKHGAISRLSLILIHEVNECLSGESAVLEAHLDFSHFTKTVAEVADQLFVVLCWEVLDV
jgi:hypothetical protein